MYLLSEGVDTRVSHVTRLAQTPKHVQTCERAYVHTCVRASKDAIGAEPFVLTTMTGPRRGVCVDTQGIRQVGH